MCKVTGYNLGDRVIHMAEIKQRYIPNIIDAARKCDYIDRVILFGSSLEERCQEQSDIDLAVFGNQPKGKCLTSKKYKDFYDQLIWFDNLNQAYDVLYFKKSIRGRCFMKNRIPTGDELTMAQILADLYTADAYSSPREALSIPSGSGVYAYCSNSTFSYPASDPAPALQTATYPRALITPPSD